MVLLFFPEHFPIVRMRKDMTYLFPDAQLRISHGAALPLRLSHFGLYNQVKAAPLTEDFLENVNQLLLTLLCNNGFYQHQMHFVRLRKRDFSC